MEVHTYSHLKSCSTSRLCCLGMFSFCCSLSRPQFPKSINPSIKSPADENAIGELYCWVFQLVQHHFLVIQQWAREEHFDNVIKCWTMQAWDLQLYWHFGLPQVLFVPFISWLFGGSWPRLIPTVLCGSESSGRCRLLGRRMLFWELGRIRPSTLSF